MATGTGTWPAPGGWCRARGGRPRRRGGRDATTAFLHANGQARAGPAEARSRTTGGMDALLEGEAAFDGPAASDGTVARTTASLGEEMAGDFLVRRTKFSPAAPQAAKKCLLGGRTAGNALRILFLWQHTRWWWPWYVGISSPRAPPTFDPAPTNGNLLTPFKSCLMVCLLRRAI